MLSVTLSISFRLRINPPPSTSTPVQREISGSEERKEKESRNRKPRSTRSDAKLQSLESIVMARARGVKVKFVQGGTVLNSENMGRRGKIHRE